MNTDTPSTGSDDRGPFTNAWPPMWVGLGAAALAAAGAAFVPAWTAVWLVLLLVGLAGAAAAVAIRPGSWKILFSAAGVALLATIVSEQLKWDSSAATLFWILTWVAAAAGGLVLMPQTARRVVVSLLIVFHFGGIFTAITAAPPQSWLSGQLWTCDYPPSFQFVSLNL